MRVQCNDQGILKASEIIKDGGIAIFPTDTVYGIGCNPYFKETVKKIYKIKTRDRLKPLPLLVYSVKMAEKIVTFDEKTKKIIEKFWPGALTVILKITDEKLKESLGVADKIAIRMPDSKCTLQLLEKVDFLIGTSANISGEKSFTDPEKCSSKLKNYQIFIDGGIIKNGVESTIIEIINDKIKIHRQGAISKEEIFSI